MSFKERRSHKLPKAGSAHQNLGGPAILRFLLRKPVISHETAKYKFGLAWRPAWRNLAPGLEMLGENLEILGKYLAPKRTQGLHLTMGCFRCGLAAPVGAGNAER